VKADGKGSGMARSKLKALSARLDVQAVALRELVRLLRPEQADDYAKGVRAGVMTLLESAELVDDADAAASRDLAALLAASNDARCSRDREIRCGPTLGPPS